MIGGNSGLADVETVVTVDSSESVERKLPDYPLSVTQAVGAFFNGEVLVCAGFGYPYTFYKDCYGLGINDSDWTSRPPLKHSRKGFLKCFFQTLINTLGLRKNNTIHRGNKKKLL